MKRPTLIIIAIALIIGGLALAGCATLVGTAGHSSAAAPSTPPPSDESASSLQPNQPKANALPGSFTGPVTDQIIGQTVTQAVTLPQNPNCATPAGWVAYQLQANETAFSIAARAAITAADILGANCLTSVAQVQPGSWIAVPPGAVSTQPRTILPLGISAFVANPIQIDAGSQVTLVWQAQGPIVGVRLGWLYRGQFIEEAANLPAIGAWTLTAPDDGRSQITYMVRVSDGLSEVAAQTTVLVTCAEGWFFAPAPAGCPFPPVMTTFHEQRFERGSIIYIPALRVHYALIDGYPGRVVIDQFVPGMPLHDPALVGAIPAGLDQPRGAIHYAWRSDAAIMTGLGYAMGPVQVYTGMLQRMVDMNGGEAVYLSGSTGAIYHFVDGKLWDMVAVQ